MMDNDCDIKWQDRLTMAFIAVVLLAALAAMIGMSKKEEIAELVILESAPLPIIEFEESELPEILPPLFDEPLPPLQGEV